MKQTNETKQKPKLGLLGNSLHMQIEACICRPIPTCTGFDLRTYACGIRAQGCSKPQPRNKLAKKQSKNENPNSNNQTCSEHKKNYKTNLDKHA